MTAFVVSGAQDINVVAQILRHEGWEVVHNDDVLDPAVCLNIHGSIIVVAHGNNVGQVFIERTSTGNETWMSTEMDLRFPGGRIYLYCCHAGKLLVPALSGCEAFGHVDAVPMPVTGLTDDWVTRFLAEARRLVSFEAFDPLVWQKQLIGFLDVAQADDNDRFRADRTGTDFAAALVIYQLRKSLNFGNPMWD